MQHRRREFIAGALQIRNDAARMDFMATTVFSATRFSVPRSGVQKRQRQFHNLITVWLLTVKTPKT
jgi:hypothetical protein